MINFIAAKNGNIELYAGDKLVLASSKVSEISFCLACEGLSDGVSFSSSMDFASEYGFADMNDALVLFNKSFAMSKDAIAIL